ncbi:MAG: aspartyl-tRNA(Asn)/glutamyl-tRNA(Gln) amidotransferase subunit [Patescibacteria group bacterium]|nr:Asp-tRNA(Asn)/Glu-tRNA(Gln) amidotransferase subunit GatC [Candidatus Saccharibacteria bacterium]MDQ5962988.1 aspartyl-tRNA(Asn)/glutamyl-tRNA(Gln) amidotransferase subunit [Patescibacteria group bacterium]
MSKLTRDDVQRLASLARISIEDDEVDALVTDLTAILDYVEQLSAVDTDGLKPTNQVTGLTNVMRPDEVRSYGYEPSSLLQNVPATQGDQIKVKRMIG